jgi:hypothetical protein
LKKNLRKPLLPPNPWRKNRPNCQRAGRKRYTGHTIAYCFHEGGGKAGQYPNWFKNRPAAPSKVDATQPREPEKSKLFALTATSQHVFLIDSGASYSSVSDYELLHDVHENDPPITLEVADGSDIIVKHKGKLIVTIDGVNREIHDVLYVPQVPQNILSIYQMDSSGCIIQIQNKTLTVHSPNGKPIFRGIAESRNRSYRLHLDLVRSAPTAVLAQLLSLTKKESYSLLH